MKRRGEVKPGEPIACVLCGGRGFLSEPWEGCDDCTCPCCDGSGTHPYHPLPPGPEQDPKPTDKVCGRCKKRNRRGWLYCWNCRYPLPTGDGYEGREPAPF